MSRDVNIQSRMMRLNKLYNRKHALIAWNEQGCNARVENDLNVLLEVTVPEEYMRLVINAELREINEEIERMKV